MHGDCKDDGRIRKCKVCDQFLVPCICGGNIGESGSHFCPGGEYNKDHEVVFIDEEEANAGLTEQAPRDQFGGPCPELACEGLIQHAQGCEYRFFPVAQLS
jgi:hypothetical protein